MAPTLTPYPITTSQLPAPTVTDSSFDANSPILAASVRGDGFHRSLRDLVSVKDYGCKVNGATDDTANFITAVKDAAQKGYTLYVPTGTMLTTASVYDPTTGYTLHGNQTTSVPLPLIGPGKVKRVAAGRTYTFTVGQLISGINILYVSPTGNDVTNDGLTPSQPLATLQGALTVIEFYGPWAVGKWQIQLLSGTYSGLNPLTGQYGNTLAYTNRDFTTFYPLQIYGPNVTPQLGAPTGLGGSFSGTGSTLANQTYFWQITAYNANGESVGSNVFTGTPTAGQNAVLTWTGMTAPSSQINNDAVNGTAATASITGYKVYRATSQLGLSTNPAFVGNVAFGTNTYTDTGTATSGTSVPPIDTTGGQPIAWIDGSGAPGNSYGVLMTGQLNVWFYNLGFRNWLGPNSGSPNKGIYGSQAGGNLRVEDCAFTNNDFGVDGLNWTIRIYGNSQFYSNPTTHNWGYGVQGKDSAWLDTNNTVRGVPVFQNNGVGMSISEASDAHPTCGYVDNNAVGVLCNRVSRFNADGLSFSRNTIGAQVYLGGMFEDINSTWWAGTSYANVQHYDLRMGATQADNGSAYGKSERYRSIDASGYSLTGSISNVKMWDSNGGALGANVTNLSTGLGNGTPPDLWQIPANFMNSVGHLLFVRVYCTLTGTAGNKIVTLKINGQVASSYTFSSATTVGGWIEFILSPTGTVNANAQMVWRNAFVNANNNLPVESTGAVVFGGSTVTGPQSVQIFGQLGNSADTLTVTLVTVSEV